MAAIIIKLCDCQPTQDRVNSNKSLNSEKIMIKDSR